ncbi:peptide-methionine (R)-S-oxide reductase MsrB [Exiguobacterium sp. 22311]|uniref:peptide-methionine (R)-S-oxide reductase MsrB n=1 Tax=Exiguobacterium sp. 22311 TaxID=3453907 RepID=UPI003F832E35
MKKRMWTIVSVIGLIVIMVGGYFVFQQQQAKSSGSKELSYQPEETAILAGGCFWCMEPPFEELKGVKSVISGYTGGDVENPTYNQVSAETTGHREAVLITFDPNVISYKQLLDVYWRQIDPTDADGQFVDRGESYTTAIFYTNEKQKEIAAQSKQDLEKQQVFDDKIVTPLIAAGPFYEAEAYHQDYYLKSEKKYKFYRAASGRDDFINRYWNDQPKLNLPTYAKLSDAEIKKKLTAIQYKVTQEDGTEPAFDNPYHDLKADGIYVDLISGEPLFSSNDKYDSKTGWPSFTKPLEPGNIIEKSDFSIGMKRMEVRSRHGNAHLGHVFSDGPEPTGLRYCMNSAALRFIPKEDLKQEGYGEYVADFK